MEEGDDKNTRRRPCLKQMWFRYGMISNLESKSLKMWGFTNMNWDFFALNHMVFRASIFALI